MNIDKEELIEAGMEFIPKLQTGGTASGAAITTMDFKLAVTRGLVPGWSMFRKFGENDTITPSTEPEDVTQIGGVIPITNDAWGTAPIVSIASTSAADAGKVVLVWGNDIYNNAVTFPVVLGTGRTALPTPLYRIYRAFFLGSVPFDGDVFVYTGTGAVPSTPPNITTNPEIRLFVSKEDNQTQHCLWTVPEGKVFIIFNAKAGTVYSQSTPSTATETCKLKFKTRAYDGLWTTKQIVSLISSGSSTLNENIENYPLIPARSDVKLTIQEVSAEMGIWAEFSGFLVDEDQFSLAELQGIRQPGYES